MKNIAIVLAAGRGARLRPLTDSIPKCMVATPDGVPLLHRASRKLEEVGATDLILGVGFKKEAIKLPDGSRIHPHTVYNERWSTTNNIYTLGLCFEYLKSRRLEFDNIFLVEGDVYLGDHVLARLEAEHGSAAAVLPSSYAKRGSCVSVDDLGYISTLRDNGDWNDPSIFKSANIYKLSKHDWEAIGDRLPTRSTSEYYEAIIGELLGKVRLKAVIDGTCREIDNSYDMYSLQESLDATYEATRANWGGLWRKSLHDHFFLANPFYPTPFIKDRLKHSLDTLIVSYPSGRRRINQLLKATANVEASFPLYAVNGASEGIRLIAAYFRQRGVRFDLHFKPSFDEYRFLCQGTAPTAEGVVVVSPNNPTAEAVTEDQLTRMLSRYRYVILDLSLETQSDTPYLELMKRHPNLIVVRSLSKLFGVPGLRIGYVAATEDCLPGFEASLPIWNINSIVECFLELHLDSLSDYERSLVKWREESYRLKTQIDNLALGARHTVAASVSFLTLTTQFELARPLFEGFRIFVADASRKFSDNLVHTRVGVKSRLENDYLLYALSAVADSAHSIPTPSWVPGAVADV